MTSRLICRRAFVALISIGVLTTGLYGAEAAAEAPKVGIRAFSAQGKRAKAVAAKVETAFAKAWSLERPQDDSLGGRAPKYSRSESARAKNAVEAAKKAKRSHVIDGAITNSRSKTTLSLILVSATGETLGTESVTVGKKITPESYAAAAKKLAALVPAPPPEPTVEEETPAPTETGGETSGGDTAAKESAAATGDPAGEPLAAEEADDASGDDDGGGFGGILAGTGMFFLGSGVTALAAGAVFTAGAFMGRDWENKATLSSGLREEVNTAIFWTSVGADVIIATGVVVTLVGIGAVTTGLLIE